MASNSDDKGREIMVKMNGGAPSQHIGNTVLVVTMEVDEAD